MVSWTASCTVTPSVMASSLVKVSPSQAQGWLHHVTQFKALHLRLSRGSSSPHLVRCSSNTGECAVVLPWGCLAGCFRVCLPAASHQPGLRKTAHRTLERPSTGRVDIIFGPMFAGKSSELLRRVKALEVHLAAQADKSMSNKPC